MGFYDKSYPWWVFCLGRVSAVFGYCYHKFAFFFMDGVNMGMSIMYLGFFLIDYYVLRA